MLLSIGASVSILKSALSRIFSTTNLVIDGTSKPASVARSRHFFLCSDSLIPIQIKTAVIYKYILGNQDIQIKRWLSYYHPHILTHSSSILQNQHCENSDIVSSFVMMRPHSTYLYHRLLAMRLKIITMTKRSIQNKNSLTRIQAWVLI